MEPIDVKDLPEPFVRAVRAMVDTLRQQLKSEKVSRQKVTLATRRGRVIGALSRREIYQDVG
jgi:hypothetical protein